MRRSLAGILILAGPMAMAQIAFEREVPLGELVVGYPAAVLFSPSEEYTGCGYTGSVTLFMQRWSSLNGDTQLHGSSDVHQGREPGAV